MHSFSWLVAHARFDSRSVRFTFGSGWFDVFGQFAFDSGCCFTRCVFVLPFSFRFGSFSFVTPVRFAFVSYVHRSTFVPRYLTRSGFLPLFSFGRSFLFVLRLRLRSDFAFAFAAVRLFVRSTVVRSFAYRFLRSRSISTVSTVFYVRSFAFYRILPTVRFVLRLRSGFAFYVLSRSCVRLRLRLILHSFAFALHVTFTYVPRLRLRSVHTVYV